MPSSVITQTFTGMDLEEARSRVLRKLRQVDTSRYSPTKGTADYDWIDDALNIACKTFAMKSKCLRTYAIIEMKAGYRTYRAPAGFIDIAAAYFYYGSYENGYEPLSIKSIDELNTEYADWRTATDSEITVIYVDRFHGTESVIGVYPIPTADGEATSFTATTAAEYEWACPLFSNSPDYGMIIQADGTDKYIIPNTSNEVVGDLDVADGNILLEYFRLPMDLLEAEQMLEIPYAYQNTIVEMAVSDLLDNNPEDSNELKRAVRLEGKAARTIEDYKKEAKPPYSGRILRARTAVESYIKNMDFRSSTY